MSGLEIPTWDPETAILIGTILMEAVLLYVGYGGSNGSWVLVS